MSEIKTLLKNYQAVNDEIRLLQHLSDEIDVSERMKRITLLNEQQQRVLKYIYDLNNSRIRQMFVMKFVENKTYVQIGHKMNTTADAVRVSIARCLKKVPT